MKGPAQGTVRLELPPGWTSSPASAEFSTDKDGDDRLVLFNVTPSHVRDASYDVTVVAELNGHRYQEGYQTVGYRGLRPYNLYRPSTYQITGVDVQSAPKLNVGYIMGSGDEVPRALESLGVNVTFLTAPDLASGDLRKYDVILLGVRTYAVRDDLKANNSRLLDYVKNGGVMVVQYNTPEFDKNYGPYPYTLTNDPEEVTDETSKVDILAPNNPVFQWPNKIGAKDFDGWVAERGSKFMSNWDPRYQLLLKPTTQDNIPKREACSTRAMVRAHISTTRTHFTGSCLKAYLVHFEFSRTWCHWQRIHGSTLRIETRVQLKESENDEST